MVTITIPKKEYERLRRFSAAYVKIAEEIVKTEGKYPYDYRFIRSLMRQAKEDRKRGKFIEAESIDEALEKFRQK